MDTVMNSPSAGCKHNRKTFKLLNRGDIPAPRQRVDEWVTTELREWVIEVAERRAELRAAREAARTTEEPAHAPSEYDDPIETATAILGGLRETYEDYRDRVDDSAPELPAVARDDDTPDE